MLPSDPSMHVLVRRSDGTVLAEGDGSVEGTLDATHFGVTVELSIDPPLTTPMPDVHITVEVPESLDAIAGGRVSPSGSGGGRGRR